MTDMTDLLARLQAATEGSAELDAEVLRAAGWRLEPVVVCSNNPLIGERLSGRWFAGDRHMGWDFVNPPPDTLTPVVGCPTRSLDAITALIEARGWEWRYRGTKYVRHTTEVALSRTRGGWVGEADSTAPLALCIAFVCALEAQEIKP